MEESIEKIWKDYRDCTVNIINRVKQEDFDSLDNEMRMRQEILNKIISMKENKDQAKKLYAEFQINKIERELELIMKQKMVMIKSKLGSISKNKKASTAYGGLGKGYATIFSKKI
ncbi:flagellar protein FliT [Clostridium autoethanogenum]|uniref:Flagellar protein FliT n=1 Tax=Clostridium autoethanogenum TaxID=84023 RepID=A0A3M0SKN2_9CLOT|nr:flagellar protein FliT [Clostridium autoethanogenum]RMC99076.1 flagellar protein FliT [Clostridium autoethanogenum]